ncbi:aquaporin-8-like [Liolophura sinensis]|uniref:aquaporin-8-like n=1 Tax=Liolophura sinensis TaxID=3198878 RepID=UPI0031586614
MAVQDLPSVVCVAIAHGLTIALLVASFGAVSGGHLNPAVTLGVFLSGGIKPLLAMAYVVAQLLGSLVGAGLVRAVLPSTTFKAIGGGAHNLVQGVGPGQGIVCETLLTMTLVLAVLMCAVDTDKNVLAPLAIGFAVTVDILAGINVTGASMNPARSFGPAVVVSNVSNVWSYHYVYWVGPLMGSLLATLLYRLCFANPDNRLVMRGTPQTTYQRFE